MSAVFVDTSSLVKFYYPEPDSDEIEDILLRAERIYIIPLAVTEIASALSKKVRTGGLENGQEVALWNTFLDDLQTGQMEIAALDERHYFKAADLIRKFGHKDGIKTLDSLQLSAAHSMPHTKFLCSDKVLLRVALKLGIKLALEEK